MLPNAKNYFKWPVRRTYVEHTAKENIIIMTSLFYAYLTGRCSGSPPDAVGFSLPQNCIATHECNGIDIIIALILNDINPLGKKRMDLVLELKVRVRSRSSSLQCSACSKGAA